MLKFKKLILIAAAALCFNAQAMTKDNLLLDIRSENDTSKVRLNLDPIGQSNFMNYFSSKIIPLFGSPTYKYRAKKIHRLLSDEAQDNMGIDYENQLPINSLKRIIENHPLMHRVLDEERKNAIGFILGDRDANSMIWTNLSSICVNDYQLNNAPIGVMRYGMHRAANQVKNNDALMSIGLFSATALAANKALNFLIRSTISNQSRSIRPFRIAAALYAGLKIKTQYAQDCKRRSDVQGLYSTGCSDCVKEVDNYYQPISTSSLSPSEASNYYLDSKGRQTITKLLKEENKVCEHHRANPEQNEN